MDKNESLIILDDLNKIINGNQKVLESLDDKNVNHTKVLKVAINNSIKISQILKKLIDLSIDSSSTPPYSGDLGDNDTLNNLKNMFGMS